MNQHKGTSHAPSDIHSPTTQDEQKCEKFSYRWWLTAPGSDETLRSLTERADRLYGVPGDDGYVWQASENRGKDVDAPSSIELLRLSRMLGMPVQQLVAHRLHDHPALLHPGERRAYCPRCIRDDQVSGRPRAFRRAWARFFLLSCQKHDVPLQWAEPRLASIADPNLNQDLKPPEAGVLEVLDLVHTFAQTLEACLWRKHAWPSNWRGTAHLARAFLIRCLVNVTGEYAAPAAAQLWLSPALRPWITFPLKPIPSMGRNPWDCVRRVGRPAWRRAALWLTAWQVVPKLPKRLRPPTIPEDYLDAGDSWWEQTPRTLQPHQLTLLYTALKTSCQVLSNETLPDRSRLIASSRTRSSSPSVDIDQLTSSNG
ncbi:hypothetical protein HF690_00145 [Oleiagrimonas citrea]|uniref:TniQ domain-containing protein n=1 Tax=Oleiagrimonas citrea TaxID=1665687 RepID=A0A846ZJ09_9GAMM|nr:hypothetical protein [Oleiagrimonas citrea]